VITAFFGVGGKTLPLCRGESVDQPQLLQLARKGVGSSFSGGGGNIRRGGACQTSGTTERAAGWVNIHSEAGIFQNDHALGGRQNGREAELGRLKWGAAKMIVHSPSYDHHSGGEDCPPGPVVIPFYVTGMDTVTPLNEHKRLIQPIPVPGHTVKVRFGPELRFDDLIAEHESREGKKLRRYHCCADPFCQEKIKKSRDDEALALNVLFSSALSEGFEKVSGSLQRSFWRAVEGCGIATPREHPDLHHYHHQSPPSALQQTCSRPAESATDRETTVPADLMYDRETWRSTAAEKQLYHLVMKRIEAAMQQLCDDAKREEEEGEEEGV
jgi:hypothetical protein